MNPANASSFRRTACGLCLLVAPALILVASIVDPGDGGDDNKDYLRALKDDPDMAQLSTALYIVGFALMVVGIIGLVHVIRERGVVLANIGGTLAILGLIFFTALVSTTINDINVVEHLGVDTADKLSDDIEDYWVAFIVFIPALLGTFLGFILLGIAVLRSKVFHTAVGVLLIVSVLLLVFSGEGSQVFGIIANALLLAAFGMIGLKLLGLTDEQWEGREPIGPGPEAPQVGGPPAGGPPPAAGPPPAV